MPSLAELLLALLGPEPLSRPDRRAIAHQLLAQARAIGTSAVVPRLYDDPAVPADGLNQSHFREGPPIGHP